MFPVMLPIDFLFAFVLALIFAWILAGSYRGRGITRVGAWPIFVVFFFLLLFVIWAGGVWLVPFGPVLWGGYWLPFVAVGIIVWLLIAAFAWESPRRLDKAQTVAPDKPGDESVAVVLTVFFWIVIVVLVAGLFTHYWWWR